MVLAELLVVAALVAVAWNVVAGAVRTTAAAPALVQPTDAASPSPSPDLPVVSRLVATAALPGLNLDSAFWRQRLDDMNRDQVFFEQLEWRVVHSAVAAMQRYLETVVVPAVRRAEHARG